MIENHASNHRRHFLKATAAGAVLGPSHLLFADEESAFHAPDLVRGEVIRTAGSLSGDRRSFTESQREIPVAGRSQVIVCGGGPAGAAAALAAARAGAEVRLVEMGGCLGGVWTAGLLTKILDTANKGGIMAELLKEFAARGSSVANRTKGTVYDPEIAKAVLEELLVEAGVKILLHTRVVGAVTNNRNRLQAIVTESKSGRQVWLADRFIDCTGDGDLAAQAGCRLTWVSGPIAPASPCRCWLSSPV